MFLNQLQALIYNLNLNYKKPSIGLRFPVILLTLIPIFLLLIYCCWYTPLNLTVSYLYYLVIIAVTTVCSFMFFYTLRCIYFTFKHIAALFVFVVINITLIYHFCDYTNMFVCFFPLIFYYLIVFYYTGLLKKINYSLRIVGNDILIRDPLAIYFQFGIIAMYTIGVIILNLRYTINVPNVIVPNISTAPVETTTSIIVNTIHTAKPSRFSILNLVDLIINRESHVVSPTSLEVRSPAPMLPGNKLAFNIVKFPGTNAILIPGFGWFKIGHAEMSKHFSDISPYPIQKIGYSLGPKEYFDYSGKKHILHSYFCRKEDVAFIIKPTSSYICLQKNLDMREIQNEFDTILDIQRELDTLSYINCLRDQNYTESMIRVLLNINDSFNHQDLYYRKIITVRDITTLWNSLTEESKLFYQFRKEPETGPRNYFISYHLASNHLKTNLIVPNSNDCYLIQRHFYTQQNNILNHLDYCRARYPNDMEEVYMYARANQD